MNPEPQEQASAVDIAERKPAEATLRASVDALRASEEQFRRAIEDAPIPVIMHAEDGEVLQISRTWTELTGYTLADVPTVDAWLNHAYGDGADMVRNHVHQLFAGDVRTLNIAFDIRTRAGDLRHWSFNASAPGTLRDGRRFVVGMALDITERKRTEMALAEKARLLDLSNDAIIVRDIHDRIVYWNHGATELYGWTREEAIGKDLHTLLQTEFEAPIEQLITTLRERDRMEGEVVQVTRDGRRITVLSRWALDRDAEGRPGAILTTYNDITEHQRAHELQQLSIQRQELLHRLMTAQEDERQRIARELHDTLGQFLTALSLRLSMLQSLEGILPTARDELARLQALTSQIDREIDRLTMELRPLALDQFGLVEALRSYVEEWSATSGVPAEVLIIGLDDGRLAPVIESTTYRIVQEALTNALKHAQATSISVLVERRTDVLRVIVEDNGVGFVPSEGSGDGAGGRHVGLIGMRERAALAGGTLAIESQPGAGTSVYLDIPLSNNASTSTGGTPG
jgi:PAS domain S-box-containing protein